MSIDFGKTAADYARYRAGFPDLFFDRLHALGIRGGAVLDLGTGTGTLARGFARRGFEVTALDRSRPLLDTAAALAAEAGLEIRWVEATAERTGLDGRFDLVSAGQCWHWFDRPVAAREARRLLRPEGRLLIAHFDWVPLAGNVVQRTEALIAAHNPAWVSSDGTGLYGAWLRDLAEAGFSGLETFSFDIGQPYTHESWRGRVRANAGIGASLSPAAVLAFDREHAAMLAEHFPGELVVPHRVFAALARA